MNRRQLQRGFTVIEAIVASAVFAVAVTSALGVYMAVLRLDSKTRAERAVEQDARFIMDYFAKEIRNGVIDYDATQDADTLTVFNQLGQQEIFNFDTAACSAGTVSACSIQLTKTGLGTTTLNSGDSKVTRLRFYLSPDEDPFDLDNDVHVQPHVTVILRIESTSPRATDNSSIDLQSTFTVRDYPSRQ